MDRLTDHRQPPRPPFPPGYGRMPLTALSLSESRWEGRFEVPRLVICPIGDPQPWESEAATSAAIFAPPPGAVL